MVCKWLENGSNDLLSAINFIDDVVIESGNDLSCEFDWNKLLELLSVTLLNLRLKTSEHVEFF